MTASPTELRRTFRAARMLARAERTLDAAQDRAGRARAVLASVDLDAVPGYAIARDADGTIHAVPVPVIDADQLALWHELTREAD